MGHRFSIALPRFGRLSFVIFFLLLACWFSLIAVGICRVDRITLDRFVDLVAMNWHVSRGSNAEANFVTPDLNHHDADVVADHDFLIYGSG
jgi:hypothetical protein